MFLEDPLSPRPSDIMDAGRKIRQGREWIEQHAKGFNHRTATVGIKSGAGDNRRKLN
jgi:hypothetical protein